MNPAIKSRHRATSSRPRHSVLTQLRRVVPRRDGVTFDEALRIAELQAIRLQELLGTQDVTETELSSLPRIRIVREPLATSGSSHWNGHEWIICLNQTDSLARQRFTLLHELKHIIDHGDGHWLYRTNRTTSAEVMAERAADYFAGCALVSKRDLKAAWGNGLQQPEVLAEHFGVSQHAMQVRLNQTGLSRVVDREPSPRCARPVRTPIGRPQAFRVARSKPWRYA